MVALTRIYTKTGDDGTTSLASGERRKKNDLRIEAYGTIDETNSFIGLARCYLDLSSPLYPMIMRIQNELFDLGADLSTSFSEMESKGDLKRNRIIEIQVKRIEEELDFLNSELAPLTSFILPGGTLAASAFHCARTVCRRGERIIVALKEQESINSYALHYVNRLSDFLFVASRYENQFKRTEDVLWKPGLTR